MQALDDIDLLREYVDHDSEEAFAILVARHINKVYSVAFRQTGNPHQAEEITQAVFVILAEKSRRLGKGVVLSGWLYQTARLTAVTFIRSEIRRARREQEAHVQSTLNESESEAWPQIAPLLDTALAGLGQKDRNAIVLRFFDGKSTREVGTALGASEEAAKKRVHRALEKLRKFFTKRGVTLSVSAIAGAVSANSVQAAPVGLTISAVAAAKGSAVTASTLTLVKGTIKMMTWAKIKTAALVGTAVILATGTTVVVNRVVAEPGTNSSAASGMRVGSSYSAGFGAGASKSAQPRTNASGRRKGGRGMAVGGSGARASSYGQRVGAEGQKGALPKSQTDAQKVKSDQQSFGGSTAVSSNSAPIGGAVGGMSTRK
jgi:RNA polymerase sigma factor (sigma-70 family)